MSNFSPEALRRISEFHQKKLPFYGPVFLTPGDSIDLAVLLTLQNKPLTEAADLAAQHAHEIIELSTKSAADISPFSEHTLNPRRIRELILTRGEIFNEPYENVHVNYFLYTNGHVAAAKIAEYRPAGGLEIKWSVTRPEYQSQGLQTLLLRNLLSGSTNYILTDVWRAAMVARDTIPFARFRPEHRNHYQLLKTKINVIVEDPTIRTPFTEAELNEMSSLCRMHFLYMSLGFSPVIPLVGENEYYMDTNSVNYAYVKPNFLSLLVIDELKEDGMTTKNIDEAINAGQFSRLAAQMGYDLTMSPLSLLNLQVDVAAFLRFQQLRQHLQINGVDPNKKIEQQRSIFETLFSPDVSVRDLVDNAVSFHW